VSFRQRPGSFGCCSSLNENWPDVVLVPLGVKVHVMGSFVLVLLATTVNCVDELMSKTDVVVPSHVPVINPCVKSHVALQGLLCWIA